MSIVRLSLRLLLAFIMIAVIAVGYAPTPVQAGIAAQEVANRATTVEALLAPGNYHYLGLEPVFRDGTVVLTLAVQPSDDLDLRGVINFLVLTEDGLRRVLAGADPFSLDIAASTPLQYDPIGNKYQAVFKTSGRGEYTVVVYNGGDKTGGYQLTALNGVLLDDAAQVAVVTPAPEPLSPPSLTATATPTETLQAAVSYEKASPLALSATASTVTGPAPSVTAVRVSGALDEQLRRHFLSVKPYAGDSVVDLELVYEPRGDETRGRVNFWLLDDDGLRQVVYGDTPADVNIATGFPEPFNPNENELVASYLSSGSNEYTVIPYSLAPVTITYALSAKNGVLIDRYGQTNEAQAAVAEYAALAASGSLPADEDTEESVETTESAGTGSLQLTIAGEDDGADTTVNLVSTAGDDSDADTAAGMVKVKAIEGALPEPFSHNYWGVTPTLRDGLIVVTMDYAPRDVQALRGHVNFWVVDEDGLRRIVAGARPQDVALAAGSEVRFGPDKGKLQGGFLASGRGTYAVIVYNASNEPASYDLRVDGGQLLVPTEDSELLSVLP